MSLFFRKLNLFLRSKKGLKKLKLTFNASTFCFPTRIRKSCELKFNLLNEAEYNFAWRGGGIAMQNYINGKWNTKSTGRGIPMTDMDKGKVSSSWNLADDKGNTLQGGFNLNILYIVCIGAAFSIITLIKKESQHLKWRYVLYRFDFSYINSKGKDVSFFSYFDLQKTFVLTKLCGGFV